MVAYHGTTEDARQNILSVGLEASSEGRIGSGVYFINNMAVALHISIRRFNQKGNVFVSSAVSF